MQDPNRLTVFSGPPGSGKTHRLVAAWKELNATNRRRAVFITVNDGARCELEAILREGEVPAPPVWPLNRVAREVLRACGEEPPTALHESARTALIAELVADGVSPEAWRASPRSVAQDIAALAGLLQRYRAVAAFAEWAADSEHETLQAAGSVLGAYFHLQVEKGLADFDRRNELALTALEKARPDRLPAFVFVDEAQELDALQVALVAAIAGPNGQVWACVDTRQRTQMYRGAVSDVVAALEAGLSDEAKRIEPDADEQMTQAIDSEEGFLQALPELVGATGFLFGATPEDQYERVAVALKAMEGTRVVLTRSNAVASEWRDALAARRVPVADHAPAVSFVGRFLRDALTVLTEDDSRDSDLPARKRAAALRLLDLRGEDTSALRRDRKETALPDAVAPALQKAAEEASLVRQVQSLALWSGWPRREAARAAQAYGRVMAALTEREEVYGHARGGTSVLPAATALAELDSFLRHAAAPEAPSAPASSAEEGPPMDVPEITSSNEVDVLPLNASAGRHWDHVVLVELEDGRFPQHATPSPWFSEEEAGAVRDWLKERTGADISMGRFERSPGGTREEERRLLLTGLSRGKQVTMSCHLSEGERELAPSPYLLTLFRAHPLTAEPGAAGECYLQAFGPEEPKVRCGACGRGPCAAEGEAEGPDIRREEHTQPAGDTGTATGEPAVPGARLSASALNDWFYCPRRYFLGRVLRLEDAEGDALAGGNLVHRAMELLHAEAERTPERFAECVEDAANEPKVAEAFASEAAKTRAITRAKKAGRIYLAKRSNEDGLELLESENLLDVALSDGNGQDHILRVKMDAVFRHADETLEVVDYKSGSPKERPSELKKVQPQVEGVGSVTLPPKDDADVQMALYAVAKRGDSLARVTHEYVCLKQPWKTASVPLTVIEGVPGANTDGFTTGDLETLATYFANVAADIKARERFEPVPRLGECGGFLFACPFIAVCDREEATDD